MTTLNCDICRSVLDQTMAGRTYWYIREYTVCEDCKESALKKVRPTLRGYFPYSQDFYENEFIRIIEKGITSKRV